MYDFSVFLAGIRPQNWLALYTSIKDSTQKTFELIFVGPYNLPDTLKGIPNVKFIQDYGCPTRCYQLGLLASASPYVVFVADDGVLLNNGAIDNAFKILESTPLPHKNIVSFRYYEGPIVPDTGISKLNYWKFSGHSFYKKFYFSQNYYLVMNALISREYMIEAGGWDCRFKHIGMGCNDLAIRMQRDGANITLGDYFMHVEGSVPGVVWGGGDHKPIYDSHCEEDVPLFKNIYSDSNSVSRIKINVNNWNESPLVWTRRFNEVNNV